MNYQNKKNSIFNPIDKPKSSNILITSQTSLKSFRKAPSMLFTRSKSIRKRTLIENLSNITRKAKPKPNNVLSKPFPLLKILTNKYTPNKTKNLIENLLTPHEVSLNDKNNLHSNESKGLKRNLMSKCVF